MVSFILTILTVGWKFALICVVGMFVFVMHNDLSLRYTNRKGMAAYAVFCICFGLAICTWVSKHLPTHPEFWTTWYFVDDVATVALTFGVMMLVRLAHYLLLRR